MHRTAVILSGVLLVIMLLGASTPQSVSAATPTPTATLRAIQPTATSLYLYLRGTPTPLTLSDIPFNPVISDIDKSADLAINVYKALNSNGLVDFTAFILVLGMLVLYLVRMITTATRDRS